MSDLKIPPPGGGNYTGGVSGNDTVSGSSTVSGGTSVGSGSSTGGTTVPDNTTSYRSSNVSTQTTGQTPSSSTDASNRLLNALDKVENAKTEAEALAGLKEVLAMLKDESLLANLLVEMSSMQRQNALDQRLASRETAKSQLEGQAAETREAAIKEISAAAVSVAMAVVSFAVSMVGALKMGGQISEIKNSGDIGSMAASVASKTIDKLSSLTQGATALSNGLSQGIAGSLNGTAKMDEAQGQILAANAQDTQADADHMKEFMNSLDDLIKAALQFVQQMNDAEVEMMASASRL